MSSSNRRKHKSTGYPEDKSFKNMIPCGEYQIREGNSETHGGDGVNGTIVVPQEKVKAAGAGPKQDVRVRVEANGKQVDMVRTIHNSGNTLTIPYDERRKLNIEPGDVIKFWIEPPNDSQNATLDQSVSEKSDVDDSSDQEFFAILFVENELQRHLLLEQGEDETFCGISLEDKNAEVVSDPGEVGDPCMECMVRSSEKTSSEQNLQYLENKIPGFSVPKEGVDGIEAEHISAMIEEVVRLEERLDTRASDLRSVRARVARLEQQKQNLETKLSQVESEGQKPLEKS